MERKKEGGKGEEREREGEGERKRERERWEMSMRWVWGNEYEFNQVLGLNNWLFFYHWIYQDKMWHSVIAALTEAQSAGRAQRGQWIFMGGIRESIVYEVAVNLGLGN